MPIGIIGAGAIGRPLAVRLAATGEQILVSNSRGPETLRDWAAKAGAGIRPVSVKEAAAEEIVVLAVPWRCLEDAVAATGITDWSGRIVVDTSTPLGPPDFKVADLGGLTSSEVVAGLVPGARLVKAFNTLPPHLLGADPRTPAGRRVIFLSGDDVPANDRVASLAASAGWATVDLGPLTAGGRLQQFPGGPLPTLSLLKEN
ncbi:NADP oxidoreductase [Streptomyces sp. 150FB]|uniref:NADPH-dependent F420 reductase n=1 Tax=Streptomyces sp. 150FB TaxID=1576605 RepID=UPI0005895B92|nr:NAD(P)-binding domain-containing protein [Streptomyces sp. 150FB]KIF72886.1 NADP oxidoreductase [Streptomyces sp. 150FB]